MSDWPQAPILQSAGYFSTATALSPGVGIGASVAWPLTNKAFFIPFRVTVATVACKMVFGSGTTAGGNVDMGIYDPQGNRLVSTGAQARSASSESVVDITDTPLAPGLYYMAMSHDGTANVIANVPTGTSPVPLAKTKLFGVMMMASAYVLPDPVTYAAVDTAYIPNMAIYTRPY